MKRLIILFLAFSLVVIGCDQNTINDSKKSASTKDRVYSDSWDGNPLIVKQRNDNGDYEVVHEITDTDEVKMLINILKNADWQEDVAIDIRPSDYQFTWNSYKHSVWINEEFRKLEFIIEDQLNYVSLPSDSSEIVFEILTGKKFEYGE